MAEARTSRDLTSRDKEVRREYKPSSTLPDPNPIPGVEFRYIATHILGQSDPTNVSRKRRDGWEPCKAVDHPELMLEGNTNGNVEIGGLMLCRNSSEQVAAMDRYYAKQNQAQMESVDNNFMRDSDPRMKKFAERNSTSTKGTTFGTGNT
jgi:hypothetical protein